MREEPHHLVDLLPEAGRRPASIEAVPQGVRPGHVFRPVPDWLPGELQVKEGAQYPPHGGQFGGGDGADTAVQALVRDRTGVFGTGE